MTVGTLYVISAPSGAGKTSLVKALVQNLRNIHSSVSHTTRPPRPKERDGVDYHFVSEQTFKDKMAAGDFLEYAHVYDHLYGTSQEWVQQQLTAGQDIILEIDWQGAQQIRRLKAEAVGIYILPPSRAELEQRLRKRRQDNDTVIEHRLRKAVEDISHYREFDYLIVNDDFGKALKELKIIVKSHRLRQSTQTQRLQALLKDLLV